jgi:hypothetical protein
VYLVRSNNTDPPTDRNPIVMRRRALIAAALGLTGAAALPDWAASAAETPDPDHTRSRNSWADCYSDTFQELHTLGARYVTHEGALDRHTIMDSGLWLYAQARHLADTAEPKHKRHGRRLAAEAAMFTAGCYIDFGNTKAATNLYSLAHGLCGPQDRDLAAFISAQANWVPMYDGRWNTVLNRTTNSILGVAEQYGGDALLMGWMHRARALAVLGDKEGAADAVHHAQSNIARVAGAEGAHTALHYRASKVWFASATTFAEIGDRDHAAEARARALADPSLGWIDRNLMQVGAAQLDPDPEAAARTIRMQVLRLPVDSFNHCIRAEALRVMGKLKAKQLTRHRATGPEVRRLGAYLQTVKVA